MENKRKKRIYLAALALTQVITLTGCSGDTYKNEQKIEIEQNDKEQQSDYVYTIVVLDGGKAILYDVKTSNSYGDHMTYFNDEKKENSYRFPSEIVRVFPSHEEAEKYALLVVEDETKVICMNYEKFNIEHDEVKQKIRNK